MRTSNPYNNKILERFSRVAFMLSFSNFFWKIMDSLQDFMDIGDRFRNLLHALVFLHPEGDMEHWSILCFVYLFTFKHCFNFLVYFELLYNIQQVLEVFSVDSCSREIEQDTLLFVFVVEFSEELVVSFVRSKEIFKGLLAINLHLEVFFGIFNRFKAWESVERVNHKSLSINHN